MVRVIGCNGKPADTQIGIPDDLRAVGIMQDDQFFTHQAYECRDLVSLSDAAHDTDVVGLPGSTRRIAYLRKLADESKPLFDSLKEEQEELATGTLTDEMLKQLSIEQVLMRYNNLTDQEQSAEVNARIGQVRRTASALANKGIKTVSDFLYYYNRDEGGSGSVPNFGAASYEQVTKAIIGSAPNPAYYKLVMPDFLPNRPKAPRPTKKK